MIDRSSHKIRTMADEIINSQRFWYYIMSLTNCILIALCTLYKSYIYKERKKKVHENMCVNIVQKGYRFGLSIFVVAVAAVVAVAVAIVIVSSTVASDASFSLHCYCCCYFHSFCRPFDCCWRAFLFHFFSLFSSSSSSYFVYYNFALERLIFTANVLNSNESIVYYVWMHTQTQSI